MHTKTTPQLIAVLALFASSTLQAQESNIKYFANISGQCKTAEVDDQDRQPECKANLVNVGYKTGRVMFLFVAGMPVAFSGDKDRQPTVNRYELDVSNVNINQQRFPARGTCYMSGDPMVSARYSCEAIVERSPPMKLRFVFESSGKPEVTRE